MTPAEIKALVERLEARETCSCGICDGTVLVNPDGPEAATMLRSFMDGGWRPIETAPKDGTIIHVWADGYEWPETVRWEFYDEADAEEAGEPGYWTYTETLMADATDDCGTEDWTHWRPLPTPPAVEGEAGE